MIWWLIVPFFVALFIGVPISFSLGIAVILFIFATATLPFSVMIETMYNSVESFPLMAIPFFIFAGELMNASGITDRLVNFAKYFLGRFRGGFSQVTIASGAVFAGLSGSAVAETAALGKTIGQSMTKEGYDKNYVGALIAGAGVLAPVIPPSVIMIVYGSQMGVSIGGMFVAGILPGLLIAAALMTLSYVLAIRNNHPRSAVKFTWNGLVQVSLAASLAFLMPVIIILGIRGGVFTPTEGGAVAVAYALFIGGFIYRTLTFKSIYHSLIRTGITASIIMLIISMSAPFGWVLSYFAIPQAFAESILGVSESPVFIITAIILMLMIVGMFLEGAAIVMLLGPVFAPLAIQIGMEPLHFAIVMVVSIAIGMVTPPLGVNLFVMVPIMNTSMERLSIAIIPFVVVLLAVLVLIVVVPGISLWLPSLSN